jgi:copper chaperone CopZ
MHFPSFTRVQRATLAAAGAVLVLGAVVAVRSDSYPTSIESSVAASTEYSAHTSTVLRTTANTRQVILHVSGMYCVSCEHTITAMLKRAPGVERAVVSVQRSQAIVVYDPTKTSPAKLIEVITNLGYRATVQRA